MSVKVIRGNAGDFKADPNGQGPKINQDLVSTTSQAVLNSAARTTLVSNEAVSVTVRTRSTTSGERIKDTREAKEVASKVADKIRDGESALGAHEGLTATNSRAHFA